MFSFSFCIYFEVDLNLMKSAGVISLFYSKTKMSRNQGNTALTQREGYAFLIADTH